MTDYLWDRSSPADPDVVGLEQQLESLAFDPAAHPFAVPLRPRRFWTPLTVAVAALAASVILIVGGVGLHNWRLDWPTDRPWTMRRAGGQREMLAVGSTLQVTSTPTLLDIARLGVLAAAPGTQLQLSETSAAHHRLTLERGRIDVRVWAPPGRVGIHTPAGDVIDLGCVFSLTVDDAGAAHLSVHTGWVNLQNAYGNSFVPAGASASMFVDRAPQVPVYDDATAEFRTAVRALEVTTAAVDAASLCTVLAGARERDALTLLLLSDVRGLDADARSALLSRLDAINPGPSPDAVRRIVNGDRDLYWLWYNSLPLPPLKDWWLNWRDVLPR